eukprot:1160500-Pelagomonas_calceolata.AAC.2
MEPGAARNFPGPPGKLHIWQQAHSISVRAAIELRGSMTEGSWAVLRCNWECFDWHLLLDYSGYEVETWAWRCISLLSVCACWMAICR